MSTAFPIFSSLETCEENCTTSLSHCLLAGNLSTFYVCKLNVTLFAGIIVLAISTGVITPLTILYCYLMECRPFCSQRGHTGTDEERQGLNSYNVQVSISGSDDGNQVPSVIRREATSHCPKPNHPVHFREAVSLA